MRGDLLGKYTYIGYNGCSTVDFVLASGSLLVNTSIIQYLTIQKISHFSDHRAVLLKLKLTDLANNIQEPYKNKIEVFDAPRRFFIDSDSIKNFEIALESQPCSTSVEYTDENNVEDLLKQITNRFQLAAKSTLKLKNLKDKSKSKRKQTNKWFNQNCQNLRKQLKVLTKALDRSPNNCFLRGKYFSLKKRYKATYK